MPTHGPVPKRSDQRVRRNKPEIEYDTVIESGIVSIPELGIPNAHPIVQDLWDSLVDSGQSRYYEPSDWQFARVALHFLNTQMNTSKPSGQMVATINSMLTDMLVSEGHRRRVRLEVERANATAGKAQEVATVSDLFRQRLSM